jgi:hypothetical protein
MPPKILVFTGAPESAALDWDSPDLLDTFIAPIARFLGITEPGDTAKPSISPMPIYAPWRSLDLDPQLHLATGYSQVHEWVGEYPGGATFFTLENQSFRASGACAQECGTESFGSESVEEALSQFYNESFAIHEDVVSSQLAAPLSSQHEAHSGSGHVSISNISHSSFTTTSSLSSNTPSTPIRQNQLPTPIVKDITNLRDIPNATYLKSIQPQTMTVNLVVGAITISPPRRITTRRGYDVELIETLVGDETKSGFGVNFWLRVPGKGNNCGIDDTLRDALSDLRPQDIVLLKNVALSSFRGIVYGQSLRKDITKVHLLYRNRVDIRDTGGCYAVDDLRPGRDMDPQISKTMLVREWASRFVGPAIVRKSGEGKVEIFKEVLPPDTQ